ncbi:unnamed protein product [Trichobilharzia regenti]|nr:unnamed protein product [Trichobilharzia regenti]
MDHVSHQCIVMQFMLELAKSLKCDPRACIRPFFAKFINPEPEYQKAFNDELSAFRERIRARAKVRLEEAMMQLEEVRVILLVLMCMCSVLCFDAD